MFKAQHQTMGLAMHMFSFNAQEILLLSEHICTHIWERPMIIIFGSMRILLHSWGMNTVAEINKILLKNGQAELLRYLDRVLCFLSILGSFLIIIIYYFYFYCFLILNLCCLLIAICD